MVNQEDTWWPYPSLLSQGQVKWLRPNTLSLNLRVKETMIEALRDELAAYVRKLCAATVTRGGSAIRRRA
jgi:hypothetical protein